MGREQTAKKTATSSALTMSQNISVANKRDNSLFYSSICKKTQNFSSEMNCTGISAQKLDKKDRCAHRIYKENLLCMKNNAADIQIQDLSIRKAEKEAGKQHYFSCKAS